MPFFTFEGIDGSGKTTAINKIAESLKHRGYSVLTTSEPYKYRNIIFGQDKKYKLEELALWLADRNNHINELIYPTIYYHPETIILCDRYTDSTLAYQSVCTGHSIDTLKKLNYLFSNGINPNKTYYLNVSINKAMKRSEKTNRFDTQTYAFYFNVQTAYDKVFENRNDVVTINANQSFSNVVRDILQDMDNYLRARK